MQANPFLGVTFHSIGALSAASCYTPQKKTKQWAWEIYWVTQATFGWAIIPIIGALLTIPDYFSVLAHCPTDVMLRSFILGFIYGFGGLTFGLGIRYIGFSLNYTIAIGISAGLGTLAPLIWHPNKGFVLEIVDKFSTTPGLIVLAGIILSLLGIVFCGWAGALRERTGNASPSAFSFKKGVPLAAMAGLLSAVFNYSLLAGGPLEQAAMDAGAPELLKLNAVLPFACGGAWATNVLLCALLIIRNRTGSQLVRLDPAGNGKLWFYYLMSLASGLFWYFQFFFYGIGHTHLGRKYGFTSWAIHMALLILFSNLYGKIFKEWEGASKLPRKIVHLGMLLIVIATSIITYGNYLGEKEQKPIKAFCIDFNWGPGGPNGFAEPGLWADADPNAHVNWYKGLGANVIQTFCVSCNGYAWYKDGVVPEQPGLKHNFLKDMARLGHNEGMMVMGYFCVGANTRWGQLHPEESYGIPSDGHIPLTKKYNDYLCTAVKDSLQKTDIDGFMLDWFFHGPIHNTKIKWLDCERQMWTELMDIPFPGKDKVTPDQTIEFARRSVARCWQQVRTAAKSVKPDCIIWLTCFDLNHPQSCDSALLREADWLMNEGGTVQELKEIQEKLGRGNLINCLAAWNKADAKTVVPDSLAAGFGLYGFTKPVQGSLLPDIDDYYLAKDLAELTGKDELNIAILARTYRNLPLPSD